MEFPNILKNLRIEKNLSHKELAKKIGYSKAIIGFWESGRNIPSLDALIKLSIFFNVSIDYLAGLETEYGGKVNQEKNNNIENSFNIRGNNNININGKKNFL